MSVEQQLRALLTHGSTLFWRGACERWEQIQACALQIGHHRSYDTPEKHIDAVLQWFVADVAKHYASDNLSDWAEVKQATTYQVLRERLLAFGKLHGRHTTTMMMVVALAREVRRAATCLGNN